MLQMKPRLTSTRVVKSMEQVQKFGKGKGELIICHQAKLLHGHVARPVVFLADTTVDSRMNSEVQRAMLSNEIQPTAAKIGCHLTVQIDNEPENIANATLEFLRAKKWDILHWPSQSAKKLKTPALKACQSISREETLHLVMSLAEMMFIQI